MRVIAPTLCALALAAAEPRWMGYDHLGPDGRPQGVVVALTRAEATRLEAPPLDIAVALGVMDLSLTHDGDQVRGLLLLPVAVPGEAWQTISVPLPGAIAAVEARSLGGATPGTLSWEVADGQLRLQHTPRCQSLVSISFVAPAAAGRVSVPVLAGLGGRLRCQATAPWRPLVADSDWSPQATSVEAGFALPADAPAAPRLAVQQQVRVALQPGRLAWTCDLTVDAAGGSIGVLRVMLPPGLRLSAVTGATARRDGDGLELTLGDSAGPIHLAGDLGRAPSGRVLPVLGVPGAATSRGRLGLVTIAGERFLRPDHAAMRPDAPAADEALAVRWDDAPSDLAIAFEALPQDLTISRDVALVCGAALAQAQVRIAVAGRGALDALRLAVPAPWRVTGIDGARGGLQAGSLLLVADGVWTGGATATVRLEADADQLAALPSLPTLEPQGLPAGRLRVAVADADDRRVALSAEGARALPPDSLDVQLPSARWRAAVELPAGGQAALRLEVDALRLAATVSHYLILGRDGVRWSLHATLTPQAGALRTAALRLPAGVRLVSVAGAGLGGWTSQDGHLDLRWTAPTTAAVAVDLELELPAVDGVVRLDAPRFADATAVHQVALVEDDDLGLVRRTPDGLAELEQPLAALPAGVDRAQVRWLWRAARDDWNLALTREALAATAGADGVATLVDGEVVLAADGEQRGSVTWHVVNRSRQQLPLTLPPGVELWEVRVDQQPVRARCDAAGAWWVPVTPMRPGQAGTRVSLTWRTPAGGALRLAPPTLGGLKVIASTWRLAAPAGHTLRRRGGTLIEAEAEAVAADRAQAVIDEIQRVQAVDGLTEAGLKRLEGQLAQLDAELKDHVAVLDRPTPATPKFSGLMSVKQAVADNRAVVQDLQQQVGLNFATRSGRRSKLNLDAMRQNWVPQEAQVVAPAWPWDEALSAGVGGGLGAGAAAPGSGGGATAALAGIDLIPDTGTVALVLRGQGMAMDADLELTAEGRSGGWIWLLGSVLMALFGWAWLRRR